MEITTPRLAPAQRIAISDYCRHLFKKYSPAHLLFSAKLNQSFTPEGDLRIGRLGAGFTCATFVAEVFERRGVALVDMTTWPVANSADRKLMGTIFKWFRSAYRGDEVHFDAAENADDEWRRLTPEQLCVAATYAPPAASYRDVKNRAKRLYERLLKSFPPFDRDQAVTRAQPPDPQG
jgi:hypothetical protein